MLRTAVCLNGEWDFMPLYDRPFCRELPETIVYDARKIQVPSSWRSSYEPAAGKRFGEIPEHNFAPFDLYGYPKEWNAAESGVLHRTFRIPQEMDGQRIVLRLDGIMQKAAVYVDRERVALWEDGYLPLRLDLTGKVQPGREHDLHVVCGSFDKVTIPSGQQKVTGLNGSWFGYVTRGIWQDVYLESYPLLTVEDITIRTSVREGRLEVSAVIGGAEAAVDPGTLKVKLTVRPKEAQPNTAPVLEAQTGVSDGDASSGQLRLCENRQNGWTGSARFQLDWKNAAYWSPDSPHLYRAVIELVDSRNGAVIDRREDLFGFREVWSEGPAFIFNGVPVNLRGDSWHFQGAAQQTEEYVRNWYRMCKQVGVNSIRLHAEPYPSYYVSIADEEGMLIVDETAIYGSSKTMQADHPDFIANCRAHVRRLVQRDKNNPSVIMWSVQNEMRWVDGRDGYKVHIPEFMTIIRNLDPTRPIIVEGDNRLLPKEKTEVESRHYNIDGTIDQWDRTVPLTFGEHGGWWYICPQNSSMYVGLRAYRNTDECAAGLAEKERLFVEYARRQGVSGISTFNFAHYFMRAMPDRDIPLPEADLTAPGPKPKRIPAYSLSLNNGRLPEEYPAYRTNPSFGIMAASFKPVTLIAAEYNRSFFDDAAISRAFDVYNDTLETRDVRIEFTVTQNGYLLHRETVRFRQKPAEHRIARVAWTPEPVSGLRTETVLNAVLYHGDQPMHEENRTYTLISSRCRTEPVSIEGQACYTGGDQDFEAVRRLVPELLRVETDGIDRLSREALLVVGSNANDPDGRLEQALKRFVSEGGRLLLLEQTSLSIGTLTLSRQDFIRAHGGSYAHPVLQGLGDDDLMFWQEHIREEGPAPIIRAAFEKPVTGDFTLYLECSAGDFGDGGDLWSPLLEYRNGTGMFLACQLEVMANIGTVPQACLLLRNMLAYAGSRSSIRSSSIGEPRRVKASAAAWVRQGGEAEAFLQAIRLECDVLPPREGSLDGYRILVAEAELLADPAAAHTARQFAETGGIVVVLPAEERHGTALARLLDRPVQVVPHESYHLKADDSFPAVQGFSPVDLFGFDKVHLSPRDVVNRPLGSFRLEIPGTEALCTSVEGTAWKDYFVGQYAAEYSRLALVELNRAKAREEGTFLIQTSCGQGRIICSQLLAEPASDKAVRLYTRLLGNLGAVFADGLLSSAKGDGHWAVESVMALPCLPHVDFAEMKDYYTDPEFSLNNLGEGLYGWMKKKERNTADGTFRIPSPGGTPWFLSCFVHVPGESPRLGRLKITSECPYEIYMNGRLVTAPEEEILLAPGINRLIAIVRSGEEDFRFGMVFLNRDGTYMNDLRYRLTMDVVEPK